MDIIRKSVLGGTLILGMFLTSNNPLEKRLDQYFENQPVCDFIVKKNELTYWKIAERVKRKTEFEINRPNILAQKLENYKDNPLNQNLRQGKNIKIPCPFLYQ